MQRSSLILLLMAALFNFHRPGSAQDTSGLKDRQPAVAGRFYPGNAGDLNVALEALFNHARPREVENLLAIICPHAGYVFSGEVAASGFNQIDPEKQYDNIFIIGSSHHRHFEGASVFSQGDYLTPLGKVNVNRKLAAKLMKDYPFFMYDEAADSLEHSIEVQIPFLQYHLKKPFRIVPVIIGTQSKEMLSKIALALKPYLNDRNLFVISTDFSHYPAYPEAKAADKATCDAIASGSSETLLNLLNEYGRKEIPNLATNLCGWTSVVVLLEMTANQPGIKIVPLKYLNSGDSKYGDKEQVVGYWSLAVTGGSSECRYTGQEKTILLKTARETIAYYLARQAMPADDLTLLKGNLNKEAGAFVTLKKHGELRGCIGRFSAEIPVIRLVKQMAVAAATQDNRFSPVTTDELSDLEIEISILTPLKKINSPGEIIPGKHGIYMKQGYHSGTFLPQVAVDNDWDVEEFLGYCARDKAGIGWDGWKTAQLYVFEACVFSEDEFSVHKD